MSDLLRIFVIMGFLSTAVFGSIGRAEAAAPALEKEDFARAKFVYFDRCSGCHGALRKGATGPNITDEKMQKKSLEELEETIFEGTEAPTALLNNASMCHERFGQPTVSTDQIIDWVAHWVSIHGETHGKPTRFEQRDGKF